MQSNMYLYCSTDFICTSYCSFITPLPPKTTIIHVEQQLVITAIIRLSVTLTVLNVVLQCTTLYDSLMDNQNANAFISNANFTEENNLVQLLENSNDFENITDVKLSPYVDIETLKENLYESKSNLSILSINTQSINAKFDEFKIAIEQLSYKHPVHTICVQETWIDSNCNTCMFELPNYQLISRGKYCSNHGGLFTYVHDDFHWEPMEIKEYSSGWENLFVKIQRKSKNSKKYIVGNIYRLPNELVSDITTFNEEFAETLDILHTKRTPTYLCGDFNIDLLKIHQKPNCCTFYDNLISSGYLLRISLPTRLTDQKMTTH